MNQIPSRIRKMPKRRQIIGMKRMIARRLELGMVDWMKRVGKIPVTQEGVKMVTAEVQHQLNLLAPPQYEVKIVHMDPVRRLCNIEVCYPKATDIIDLDARLL